MVESGPAGPELNDLEADLSRLPISERERVTRYVGAERQGISLEEQLVLERRSLAEFHEANPDFLDTADRTLDYFLQPYGITRSDRSKVRLAGKLEALLERLGTETPEKVLSLILLNRLHPEGEYWDSSDTAYAYFDPHVQASYPTPVSGRVAAARVYLHEGLHGAGWWRQRDGRRKRGFGGALEEGVVELMARRAALSMLESDEEREALGKSFENSAHESSLRLVRALGRSLGERVVMRAHFLGEEETLQTEIDTVYGAGAYQFFVSENWGYVPSPEHVLCAEHARECRLAREIAGGDASHEKTANIDTGVARHLARHFLERSLERDFMDFSKGTFGDLASAEGRSAARDYLSREKGYAPAMVGAFFAAELFQPATLTRRNPQVREAIDQIIDAALGPVALRD